jgi:hypothetical protein
MNSLSIEDLKKQRRWVLWRLETRDGKETKVPYQPNGYKASSVDARQWSTFAEVDAAKVGYSGVGVVLGLVDGVYVSGVDIDHCYDPDSKKTVEEARQIVKGLDSYAEISPSGDGVHVLVIGSLNGRTGTKQPFAGLKSVEVYDGERYLTFTGRHIGKTPNVLHERTEPLNALYDRVAASKPRKDGLTVTVSVSEAKRLQKLMAGDMSDYDGDHSKADFALCCLLAKKHDCDWEEIDADLRKSGLYREKWERDGYRKSTIKRAIKAVAKESVIVFDDSDTMAEDGATEYLVEAEGEGWFPKGDVSLIGGSSGVGKTSFVMPMLEQIRRGEDFLGHKTKARDYRVLLHDRSKKATGRTIKALGLTSESAARLVPLSLTQKSADIGTVLDATLAAHPGAEVWFIEGLDLWIPNMNDSETVQSVLSSIVAVAQRYDVAVLGSVGAPKQKGPDRYHGRDVLFGSSALARKTETIVALSYHDEKDLKSPRVCWIMARNGPPEKMFFDWVDGKFTKVDAPPEKSEVATDTIHKVHVRVRAMFGADEPIVWKRELGPNGTFYRWRDWAVENNRVVVVDRKYIWTPFGLATGVTLN